MEGMRGMGAIRLAGFSRWERYLAGVLLCFLGAALAGWVAGFAAPGAGADGDTNGVPHLALVEQPAIYRGGQPNESGWRWLVAAGVSNVVKLNPMEEGSDAPAAALGMAVHYFPVDTMEQLVGGPDPEAMRRAVDRIGPGTFIHCQHGQDRTGLVVGLYRMREGTNKPAAWGEMMAHGFHPALRGLTDFWERQ